MILALSTQRGVVALSNCIPGRFAATAGHCKPCPAGKYQPLWSARMCLVGCPKGTYKTGITCLPCAHGRYNRGLPPGSTSARTVASCVPCPHGRHGLVVTGGGSVAPTASCASCAAGRFVAHAGALSCESCAAGREGPTAGRTSCAVCAAGQYSKEGWARCRACPAGRFRGGKGGTHCTVCPVGTLDAVAGAKVCKSRCLGGACRSCPPGKFFSYEGSTGMAGSCRVCSAGRFNSKTGALGCAGCPTGKHQPRMHSVFCRDCVRCEAGQQTVQCSSRQRHSGTCAACPEGRASAKGTRCGAGCAADHVQVQRACLSCSAGAAAGFSTEQLKAIHSSCRQQREQRARRALSNCAPGKFLHHHAPGDVDASNAWECALCPAGRFQSKARQSACKACRSGWVSGYGATACHPKGGGKPTECPLGTWGRLLDLGAELGGASVHCYDCPPGRFGPKTTYWRADGKRVRAATLPGDFGMLPQSDDADSAVCFACPEGKHQKKKGQSSCIIEATAKPTMAPMAMACPVGRYASAQRCAMCPAGKFKVQRDLPQCSSCPAGKYQSKFGQALCSTCEGVPGTTRPGQTTCAQKETEKAGKKIAKAGTQKLCDRGEFFPVLAVKTSKHCLDCPLGKYQPAKGRDNCWTCNRGKSTRHRGSAECIVVPTAAPTPAPLPPTPAPTTAPVPTPFPTPLVMVPARACPAGRYTNKVSLQGFQVQEGAAIKCWLCPTGKFSPARRPLYVSQFSLLSRSTVVVPAAANSVCTPCGAELLSEPRRLRCVSSCAKGSYAVDVDATSRRLLRISDAESESVQEPHFSAYYRRNSAGSAPRDSTTVGSGHFASFYAKKAEKHEGVNSVSPAASPWQGHFGAYQAHEAADGWREFKTAVTHKVRLHLGALSSTPAAGPALPKHLSATEVAADEASAAKELKEAVERAHETSPFLVATPQARGCVLCPPGQFQANSGSKWCENCPSGQFQRSTGAGFCNACPAGRHQPHVGAAFCAAGSGRPAQAPGTGSLSSAFDFLASMFGKTTTTTTTKKKKLQSPTSSAPAIDQPSGPKPVCPAGRYVTASLPLWFCAKCPAGKFQPSPGGHSGCHSMHEILFPPTPAPTPVPPCSSADSDCCEPGYFSVSKAQIPCRACPIGQWSGPALHPRGVPCSTCAAGQTTQVTAANRASLCTPDSATAHTCPLGSVTQSGPLGERMCVICPSGRFSQDPRMSRCMSCQPGRFNTVGSHACNVCPRGKHSDKRRVSCTAYAMPASSATTPSPATGGCKCAPAPRAVLRANHGVACSSLGFIMSQKKGSGTFRCYQIPRAGCMCCGPSCNQ